MPFSPAHCVRKNMCMLNRESLIPLLKEIAHCFKATGIQDRRNISPALTTVAKWDTTAVEPGLVSGAMWGGSGSVREVGTFNSREDHRRFVQALLRLVDEIRQAGIMAPGAESCMRIMRGGSSRASYSKARVQHELPHGGEGRGSMPSCLTQVNTSCQTVRTTECSKIFACKLWAAIQHGPGWMIICLLATARSLLATDHGQGTVQAFPPSRERSDLQFGRALGWLFSLG